MSTTHLPEPIDRLDVRITRTLARIGVPVLRVALGIVFFWFGFLKFFPSLSPAETLAARTIQQLTFGLVPPAVSLPVLATWESVIGIGLIVNRGMRRRNLARAFLTGHAAPSASPQMVVPGMIPMLLDSCSIRSRCMA